MVRKFEWNLVIVFVAIAFILMLPFVPPLLHQVNYYEFADKRTFFGIRNAFNVISSLLIIIPGMYGLTIVLFNKRIANFYSLGSKYSYLLFFIATVASGICSSYYHIAPFKSDLAYEILPMILVFIFYFTAVFIERVRYNKVRIVTFVIVFIMFIIFHWQYGKFFNPEDLRFYLWVQFLPLTTILILLLFPPIYTHTNLLYLSMFWYVIAKIAESYDYGFYSLTKGLISGHTMDHIIATFGVFTVAKYLTKRKFLPTIKS